MSVREHDVRQLARLVRHVREAGDEGDLADRVGELEPRGQGERRIHARADDEDFDLAARHRAGQVRDLRIRSDLAVGRIGAESHGLSDVAGGRVQ